MSKEFTDSKIIGILAEPFRSRIREIKSKARMERDRSRENYINNCSKIRKRANIRSRI